MVQDVSNEHKQPDEFARKIIDGVPSMSWGAGKSCTFAGALEAAMAVTKHPYSYADLMGWSGLAFRVRWHHESKDRRWDHRCAIGEMDEEIGLVQQATGWTIRDKIPPEAEDISDALRAINSGRPVVCHSDVFDMAVLYGYSDGGKQLVLRDYRKGREPLELSPDKLRGLLLFLEDHADGLSPRDALSQALRIAVRNWRRNVTHADGFDCIYGDAAMARWIDDLSLAETFSDSVPPGLFSVNGFAFRTLVDARETAAAFLRNSATLVDGAGRGHIEQAAEIYARQSEMLAPAFASNEIFLDHCTSGVSAWTTDTRRREQEILRESRSLDNAAIAEIDKVLAATACNG